MKYEVKLNNTTSYFYSEENLSEAIKFAKENQLKVIERKTKKEIYSKEIEIAEKELTERLLKGGWQSFIKSTKKNNG